VFVLGGEAGRLFKPLAFTKTFAMGAASVLEVGAGRFDPAEARRLAAAVEVHELLHVS